MRDTYETLLIRLAQEEERLVVLTAENRVHIQSLPAALKERFVDVGICEQTLVAVAAGLALRGKIPIVHGIAAFLTMRAYEFIRTDIGIPDLNVKFVGSFPGLLSEGNGPTHQALEDLALMRLVPNMTVLAPSDEEDLLLSFEAAFRHKGPAYIRYTNVANEVVNRHSVVAIGRSETIIEGMDATILVHGVLTRQAVLAARLLTRDGISVRVVNVRSLQPLDEDAILRAARETRILLTLEDHRASGGLSSIAAECVSRQRIPARLVSKAVNPGGFHPARLQAIIDHEGFSAEAIARHIKEELSKVKENGELSRATAGDANTNLSFRRE